MDPRDGCPSKRQVEQQNREMEQEIERLKAELIILARKMRVWLMEHGRDAIEPCQCDTCTAAWSILERVLMEER